MPSRGGPSRPVDAEGRDTPASEPPSCKARETIPPSRAAMPTNASTLPTPSFLSDRFMADMMSSEPVRNLRIGRSSVRPVSVQSAALEPEIQRVGQALADAIPSARRHPLRALDHKAMEVAERDEQLRAALFRLVDVTPACRSLDDLAEHLAGYLDEVDERTMPLDAAMRMAGSRAGRKALGAAAAAGVRHMAHGFIVGESARGSLKPIGELWSSGIASSVDLLGEATVTEEEAERYAGRCREMLETLTAGAARWPERPALEHDSVGAIPRVNVSVKVTALTPHMRPEAPAVGREDAARRLGPLLRSARELGAHLHVDMESVDALETTEELLFALLDEADLRVGPSVGLCCRPIFATR